MMVEYKAGALWITLLAMVRKTVLCNDLNVHFMFIALLDERGKIKIRKVLEVLHIARNGTTVAWINKLIGKQRKHS
jgi:hypothetical protein